MMNQLTRSYIHQQDETSHQIESLLEVIYSCYGYDFRQYGEASMRRRITTLLRKVQIDSIPQLQEKILISPEFFEVVLNNLTITVTEFFRDPSFYRALQEKVFPQLKKLPLIKIWIAGCATGEEVYSLAILLKELNLYERCQIIATDINKAALKKAKSGIFSVLSVQNASRNYFTIGGKKSFHHYISTAEYGYVCIQDCFKPHIIFQEHNLATDQPLDEMNLILCRNVIIYFNQTLQAHVHHLLLNSLSWQGFLCLGHKENLLFSPVKSYYVCIDLKEKIYQKEVENVHTI